MTSGYFSPSTSNSRVDASLYWEVVSQSIEDNTSDVYVCLRMSRNNSGYETWGQGTFWVGVDGQRTENYLEYSITENSNTLMCEGTFTVTHYDDGSFWIYVKCGGNGSSITVDDFSSAAYEVYLPTIPRTSNVHAADDGTFGVPTTITIDKKSDSFTHTLSYEINGHTGEIASGVGTSYSWTPSKDWCSWIPNNDVIQAWVHCKTYNGDTYIGESKSWIRLAVPSDVIPSVSIGTISGQNSTFGGFIQTISTASVPTTALGSYGSTITSIKIEGNGATSNKSPLNTKLDTSGTITFKATATDSRGRVTSATKSITVQSYYTPIISEIAVWRVNSKGKSDENGEYTILKWVDSVRALSNNTRTVLVQYQKKDSSTWETYSSTISTTTSGEKRTCQTAMIPTSSDYSFNFKISVKDAITNTYVTRETMVSTGYTIFDVDPTGKMIAFGKVAEKIGMDIDMPLFIKGISFIDYVYPVGSFYITMNNIEPSTLFGGTWNKVTGKFLLGTSDEYKIGDMGGETTHKLTVDEIPAHSHSTSNLPADWAQNLAYGDEPNPYGQVAANLTDRTTSEVGGSIAHNNMPPYLAVNIWYRVS